MENFAHNLLLLTANLSQLHNSARIKQLFLEGVSGLFPDFEFLWTSENSIDASDYEVCTKNSAFGGIKIIKGKLNSTEQAIFKNTTQMLGVILENVANKDLKVRELQIEQEKYQLLFKNSPIGIMTYNTQGEVLDVNNKLIEILGSPSIEATKKLNIFSLPALVESGIAHDLGDGIETGKTIANVKKYQSIWGISLSLKYTITPVFFSGSNPTIAQVIVEDFTQYEQTQEQLLKAKDDAIQNERKVKSLLDAIPDLMFVFNKNGIILDYNAAEDNLYSEPKNFLNKSIFKILPGSLAQLTMQKIEETLKNGVQEYEYSLIFNGETHIYETRMVPLLKDKTLAIVREMTQVKKAQKELRQTNAQLELRTSISNAFLRFNDNRFYQQVLSIVMNQLASKYGFFGYIDKNGDLACPAITDSVWTGDKIKSDLMVFKKENWKGVWGESLKQNKSVIKNGNLVLPSTHIKLENVIVSPISNDHGSVIGQVAVARNTDEYSENDLNILVSICNYVAPLLNARLKEMRYKQQLINAKNQAEESDRLKSAFLANMSHEIRTPMNGIVNFAQMLKKPSLSKEKQAKYVNIVNHQSTQLLHIISDIVDISKLEAGQAKIYKEEIDLNEMITDLQSVHQRIHSNPKVGIVTHTSDEHVFLYSDQTKIQQILTNLINNALKFTAEGTVEFGYEVFENEIMFFVKDTGFGIPKNEYDKIFERFMQLETNQKKSGTGLGLSICKGFAELLGGRLSLESTVGEGTTFYFYHPK